MNVNSPGQSVTLEFRRTVLNAGQARFNLGLGPGELALFEAGESIRTRWIGDVALGLVEPVAGEIWFQGVRWAERSLAVAEQCRRRVGRVFALEEGAAFLQNLDLDENILLAQRFDSRQSSGEVANRALEVAGRFGMDGLPRMRPAVAKRRTLQLAQWVRAFLPKSLDLLVLDVPLRGVTDDDVDLLLANVAGARRKGTAVIWVETAGVELLVDRGLEPTWRFGEFPAALHMED